MTKKLDSLLAAQKKIADQIRLARAGESEKKRREETRKLILMGRAAERLGQVHENYAKVLKSELEWLLDKPADRELFGLRPRAAPPENQPVQNTPSENPQA